MNDFFLPKDICYLLVLSLRGFCLGDFVSLLCWSFVVVVGFFFKGREVFGWLVWFWFWFGYFLCHLLVSQLLISTSAGEGSCYSTVLLERDRDMAHFSHNLLPQQIEDFSQPGCLWIDFKAILFQYVLFLALRKALTLSWNGHRVHFFNCSASAGCN